MKVMNESKEYKEYFDEVQGYYQDEEKKEVAPPIGKRLKELRKMQNMSLEQFSKITGIDKDKLKNIEDHRILPDLGIIVKLSKALRIGTSLQSEEKKGFSYSLMRKQDRHNIKRLSKGGTNRPNYQFLSLANGIEGRHMESFLVTLTPDTGNAELSSHDGEEFVVVMEGAIKVILGNKEEILKEGDSIYYLANIPHNIINASEKDKAVIMVVIYIGK
jgi:quercetin dioxygenase-like cupin family protein